MTTSEAAKRLNTTKANVLRMINAKNAAKRLPARRCKDCGAGWIIEEGNVEQFSKVVRTKGRPRKESANEQT